MSITLTVFFEDPFYVGLFERVDSGTLTVSRAVFGAEPSDATVHAWLLENFFLLRFSPPVDGAREKPPAKNPKRRQRQTARSEFAFCGTKAQQAMKLAHEENKAARKARFKERDASEAERKRLAHIEKKKAQHRGH